LIGKSPIALIGSISADLPIHAGEKPQLVCVEGRTDEKKPFSLLDAARLFNDDAF
jgi:hypothetical protein